MAKYTATKGLSHISKLGESILTSISAKHQSPGIIHLLNVSHHLCVSEAVFCKYLGFLAVI